MKDEYGRINNRAQVIRDLNKMNMAHVLNDIKKNPDKYPDDIYEWYSWLDTDSGENLDNL